MQPLAQGAIESQKVEESRDGALGASKRARQASVRAFRACLILLCAFAIYFALRQGIGAWYFHQNTPPAVERAAQWDPENAQYADVLANLAHFYSANPDPSQIVALCEKAVRLSPHDAHYWADLGSAYDWAGRPDDAQRAFERSLSLFPNSPEINWRLANFYARTNRADDALPLLRRALVAGGVDDRQVFALVSRSGLNNQTVMTRMLPPDGALLVDYLDFQVDSGRLDRAGEVWDRLLRSGLPFRIADAFPYFDALVRAKNADAASRVWDGLGRRFPAELAPRTADGNLITDGDFELPILNGGFDWRVNPVRGAAVRIEPGRAGGGGLLRIDFDGRGNLEYGDVLQLVPVRPSTHYVFSAEVRAQGITTDSGPRFELVDADAVQVTEDLIGTSGWSLRRIGLRTGPLTRLLWVRIARPASHKLDDKISGTFLVRRVSLKPQDERRTAKQPSPDPR
ncbi:MAG TPA: tetratricopeptide repeat protein [Candidatus Cybelea sp.]|nr:tetratricopeptide repeat protein [Candidatus Cybelea sp.]